MLSSARTGSWTHGPGGGAPAEKSLSCRMSKEQKLSGAPHRGSGGQVGTQDTVVVEDCGGHLKPLRRCGCAYGMAA